MLSDALGPLLNPPHVGTSATGGVASFCRRRSNGCSQNCLVDHRRFCTHFVLHVGPFHGRLRGISGCRQCSGTKPEVRPQATADGLSCGFGQLLSGRHSAIKLDRSAHPPPRWRTFGEDRLEQEKGLVGPNGCLQVLFQTLGGYAGQSASRPRADRSFGTHAASVSKLTIAPTPGLPSHGGRVGCACHLSALDNASRPLDQR